ncbi:MAG: tandem-95 repeat protein [Chloroflexi bacterium]|nr:tandem-95 repeat protein [Chloroflexota bacterium]
MSLMRSLLLSVRPTPLILVFVCAASLFFSACTPAPSDPITTIAGGFSDPLGVAVDSSGNVYIADSGNHLIRKVDASGNSSTFAGNHTSGYSGDGGAAISAELSNPSGVAVDSLDNVYIADTGNHVVRMVDGSGNITTTVGTGTAGYSGDGGAAISAELSNPSGVALDSLDNLYIADTGNHVIRMMDGSGNITTMVGTGTAGYSGDGALAINAQLDSPHGVALDNGDNLYIADTLNHVIRTVDSSGNITTTVGMGTAGKSGDGDLALNAQLDNPYGVAVDSLDNIYVADAGNQRIRKIDPTDESISTFAGTGAAGYSGDGGNATSAELNNPRGVAIDSLGNVYIADTSNQVARKVTALQGLLAVPDKAATRSDRAVTIDVLANDRDVDSSAIISVTAVGAPISGTATITCSCMDLIVYTPTLAFKGTDIFTYTIEDSAGLTATATVSVTVTDGPIITTWVDDIFGRGVAIDKAGNVYVADYIDNIVYKFDANRTRAVFAGNGAYGYSGDGGPAISAQLDSPIGLAVDRLGNVYIADNGNGVIRKVTPNGKISTVAGTGVFGYSGDGGPATNAQLDSPVSIAVDDNSNLYIADSESNVVRKVDGSGTISTVAGTGVYGYRGDGGSATNAEFDQPFSVKVDGSGNLYIADLGNNVVRKVDSGGMISTVAGNGTAGDIGNGGLATRAELRFPLDLALDSRGALYIADIGNNIIRKVDPSGTISIVAGTGAYGYGGDDGPAIGAEFYLPMGIVLDRNSNLYIADLYNQSVRLVVLNHAPVAVADSASTTEEQAITLGVLANDHDVDSGDSFSVTVAGAPLHGGVLISGTTQIVYTPVLNFVGVDSFVYTIADGAGLTATATVSVTVTPVNDAPTATADSYSIGEDQALRVNAPGVLNNDSDIEHDPLHAVLVSGPNHGALTLNADGSFTYTPTANYMGTDSFTYKANDGALDSAGVSVNLLVTPVNDAPTASADSYSIGEDQALSVSAPGVLSNDSDMETDPLTVVLVSGPSHGTLALNADGSFTYTPAATYVGVDSFTYKANDGFVNSNAGLVNLTILAKAATHTSLQIAPNPALIGQSVTLTATVTPLNRTLPNLTGNVTFQEGDLILGTAPLSNNFASFTKSDWSAGLHPITAHYSGDSLSAASVSIVVTQQIVVLPLARNDVASTPPGQAVTMAVLANDLDPAAGGLIVESIARPAHGGATITASGQTVTYTPTPDFQGIDSFTYVMRDQKGQTDQALVVILVGAAQVGSVSSIINTELAFSGSQTHLSLTLPAGVYPENLTAKDIFYLAYTQSQTANNPTTIDPGLGNLQFGNLIFDLAAYANAGKLDHFNFASPVTLTITYDPALVGALQPETLTLLYWNGTMWTADGITVLNHNVVNHQLTVTLAHLSEFGLFGQIPSVNPGQRLYLPWISR